VDTDMTSFLVVVAAATGRIVAFPLVVVELSHG
jgi:hypothetical protein